MTTRPNTDPSAEGQSTICVCGHSQHEHAPYPEDDGPYYACTYDLCGCEDYDAAYALPKVQP